MKLGLYSRIAWNNIKKNYRFFIPRILTGMGLLGSFYIVLTLAMDKRLQEVKGGAYLPTIMGMGAVVVGILSVILLLYTNSFLMKQRKREFGLYNVLGMEKRHIARVLLGESLISGGASLMLGMGFGVLFYKMATLLICKLLAVEAVSGFYFISFEILLPAAGLFVALDAVTYGINCIRIGTLKPVELLASTHTGEREPKVKWLLLIVGVLSLGAGYYIALATDSPLKAIYLFFWAVLLVILGTYCLFVTGTTFVLRVLKSKEKYFYHPKHMPSVSGLLYRMKQNAVGLASIAIMATAVLVMISTTVSLYSGMEESLAAQYPQDAYVTIHTYNAETARWESISDETAEEIVRLSARRHGVEIKSVTTHKSLQVAYYFANDICYSEFDEDTVDYDKVLMVAMLTAEEYEAITGERVSLTDREILVCPLTTQFGRPTLLKDHVTIEGKEYHIQGELTQFPVQLRNTVPVANTYGIILPNEAEMERVCAWQKAVYGDYADEYESRTAVNFVDVKEASKVGDEISEELFTVVQEYFSEEGGTAVNFDAVWMTRDSMYGMYGTFLFLGLLLGMVFLFATALVIYYKQISEGYEDRERFQIMKKIGMSEQEVRATIRSQVILVFFLPLAVAGVHIIVAFPMLTKLLHVLLLSNTWLFVVCTAVVFVLFSLIYLLIYTLTAKTYYKIVR